MSYLRNAQGGKNASLCIRLPPRARAFFLFWRWHIGIHKDNARTRPPGGSSAVTLNVSA